VGEKEGKKNHPASQLASHLQTNDMMLIYETFKHNLLLFFFFFLVMAGLCILQTQHLLLE
jgi:hypothetical protein